MSSEWETVRLGEVASFKTGKLDSNAAEEGGRYPFFTCSPNTMAINTFAFDTEAVILAGNNANGVFSCKRYSGKFNAYQRTYVIEPLQKNVANCRYLFYFISHQVNHLRELSVGSATKFLTKTILDNLPVALPKIEEQESIAGLLAAFDDRITLLRETNATLEGIAQALFKSWFVDFDPVHAKQQGRAPEGMDEATAALFPDRFEVSELGSVPKGWRIGLLGDELKIAYGKNLPTNKLLSSGYPVFGGNGQIGFFDKYLYKTRQVLVSCRGAASGKVNQSSPEAFVTNNSLVLESDESSLLSFGYLKGRMRSSDLMPFVTGSAQPQVTIDNLRSFRVLVPSVATLRSFEAFSSVIENRIQVNDIQIQALSTLRDTLLPRLISGQLRLSDAESIALQAA